MLLEGYGRGVLTIRGFQPCCPIGWDSCHLPLLAQQPARKSFEVHVGKGQHMLSTCVLSFHVSFTWVCFQTFSFGAGTGAGWIQLGLVEDAPKGTCWRTFVIVRSNPLWKQSSSLFLSLFPRRKCPRESCSALKPKSPPSQPVRFPFTALHTAILPTLLTQMLWMWDLHSRT